MSRILRRLWFLLSLAITCWLGMMLLHECGHMFAAIATGGKIHHLVFHPLVFSRTDISPNPHPLFVAWAGPVFGAAIPLGVVLVLRSMRRRSLILEFFAAFCLLANGAYIGIGVFDFLGDAGDLRRLGSPLPVLMIFGSTAIAVALVLLHQQGRIGRLLFTATRANLIISSIAAILLTATGLLIDGR